MTTTSSSLAPVPAHDKQTRRRAAVAAGKAYAFTPVWWFALVSFGAITIWSAATTADAYRVFGWSSPVTVVSSGGTALVLCLTFFFVPIVTAVTIYRAPGLYYLDNGQARAALVLTPVKDRRSRRRTRAAGDEKAHSLGAWPKGKGAGKELSTQVRDLVHAKGGRVTGTAMPGLAKTYKKHGMVEVGRTAWFLIRIASDPTKGPDTNPTGADSPNGR